MKHMTQEELKLYKIRIKAARQAGKSNLIWALCEYVLFQNTLSYFKELDMNHSDAIVSTMQYNVKVITYADPIGRVVASFTTLEQAEATREAMNNNTHPSMLTFFTVETKGI